MYIPTIPSYNAQGFFTPYSSASRFRAQFKAPITLPFMALTTALHEVINLLQGAYLGIVDLAVLDFSGAGNKLYFAGSNLIDIPFCIVAAVLDPILASLAFITRSILTLGCLISGTPTDEEAIVEEYDGGVSVTHNY